MNVEMLLSAAAAGRCVSCFTQQPRGKQPIKEAAEAVPSTSSGEGPTPSVNSQMSSELLLVLALSSINCLDLDEKPKVPLSELGYG